MDKWEIITIAWLSGFLMRPYIEVIWKAVTEARRKGTLDP